MICGKIIFLVRLKRHNITDIIELKNLIKMCIKCYERMIFSESAMYFGVRGELGIVRNVLTLLSIQYLSFSPDSKTVLF